MRTTIKESRKNYMDALIHISKVGAFEAKQVERNYKISKSFTTACCDLGLVTKYERTRLYKWCLEREPNFSDVTLIKKNLKTRHLLHLENQRSKQLTIKPVRKAPAPTQIPVVHEPECDNSNSKMLLIMMVGAIIGFMIATIIWK
jgi:hypothetical protein